MNLSTSYLGLQLKSPIIVSSSTFTANAETIAACAEAGAGAVVLKSIFEEQILADIKKEEGYTDIYNTMPEAQQYLKTFLRGNEIEHYVNLIKEAKKAVSIPVIASINCTDKGEWTSIAKKFQDAGADALELNIAIAPFDKDLNPRAIEDEYIEILKQVKKLVSIPVSVKIGSHFTNICNMAFQLVCNGANGLVLFNRFYNADIDINSMKAMPGQALSSGEENSTTLRHILLLAAQGIACDLSASTGINDGNHVVKQILAGASSVQVCSVLYRNGIDYIRQMLNDIEAWMQSKGFSCLADFKGKVNREDDLKLTERLQYLRRNSGMN